MKKVKIIALSLIIAAGMTGSLYANDKALLCTSSSTGACAGKGYCCYSGNESAGDKFCKAQGCVRGGTGSCPTAANVKSCGTRTK